MHLNQTGPTKKTYVPASTTSQYIPKRSVSVGQGYSHRFLILQVLTFKCRGGSTFCRGTTPQLQTPAAQNLFQNKHAPEAHWTNKKPYVPASTTSQYIPKKKAFQWAKAIHIGSWFYRCWHSSVVEVLHFAEAPPPSSRLQQPKTCSKTNMHLKHTGPTKKHTSLLAHHHNTFRIEAFQWAKAIVLRGEHLGFRMGWPRIFQVNTIPSLCKMHLVFLLDLRMIGRGLNMDSL